MAKSKLTSEVEAAVIESISVGNYAKVAAEQAGIDESTFYRWMREGEVARSGKMRQFYQSVTRAQGEAESVAVAAVGEAGKKDWRAYAWLLERRYSERWANTQKIEVAVEREMSGVLEALEQGLGPHSFREVMAVLAGDNADSAVK